MESRDFYGAILVRFNIVAVDVSNQFKPGTIADFVIRVNSPSEFVLVKNRASIKGKVFNSLEEVFGYIRGYYDIMGDMGQDEFFVLGRDQIIINTDTEFEDAVHQFLKRGKA